MSRLNGFLKGTRVLDVSAYIPGPMASLLLADMGAEVIKVEPPAGDGMRELGPLDEAGTPLFHAAINAGKSVCRLDLKSAAGLQSFLHLVDDTDVLIEGFRPGAMKRLGLDYEALSQRKPSLVYCSVSGYGSSGPDAARAGHDANYVASAGMLYRNGTPPRFFDPPVSDINGALFATIAILGALHRRTHDGTGCLIDLGLADTPMLPQQFALASLGALGVDPRPDETYLNGGAAYYRVYRTRDDRHIVVGAIEPKFWRAFCELAERPDWIERHREALPQRALSEAVQAFFSTLTAVECIERFANADCCVSLVQTLHEAVASPHHAARGLVRPSVDGALQALFPAWTDGAPPAPRKPLRPMATPEFTTREARHRSPVSN